MKIIKHIFLAFIFIFLVANLNAQINKANKFFIEKKYEKAIECYEKAAKETSKSAPSLYNLAQSNAKVMHYEIATENILMAAKLRDLTNPEELLLAECWLKLGELEKAKEVILKKGLIQKDSTTWTILNATIDSLILWKTQNSDALITNIETINTTENDFSPIFNDSSLYFISDRNEIGDNDIFANTNPTASIWKSQISKGEFLKPKKIFNSMNELYVDGSFAITSNEKFIYFTRSIRVKNKKNQSNKLQIFQAEFIDGKWGDIQKLSFSNSSFNFTHPAISKDGKIIIFSSDQVGSLGEMDLWMSHWTGSNWTDPSHLSGQINTRNNDLFPTIFEDTLYYATDGLIGYGGMDIYKLPLNDLENKPINMKAPINSAFDDFGICFKTYSKGYFSSNRLGGKGQYDIYAFDKLQHAIQKPTFQQGNMDTIAIGESLLKIDLFGQIYNQNRGDIEAGLLIYLLDEKGKIIAETFTNEAGNFNFRNLFPDDQYLFRIRTDNPNLKIIIVNQKGELLQKLIRLNDGDFVYVRLNPDEEVINLLNEEDVEIQIKPQENFLIPNIYYELNSYSINTTAETQLKKLASIIKKNPHITVQLFSHTDARASAAYNLELSKKRVQSAIDYLVGEGVDPLAVNGIGIGEAELLNQCADNVFCTEEEHAVNRRTEFKISRK